MAQIEQLLGDIRAVLAEKAVDRIASEDLVAALVTIEGGPWAEMGLTQTLLGQMLKPIAPEERQNRQRGLKGYHAHLFADGTATTSDTEVAADEDREDGLVGLEVIDLLLPERDLRRLANEHRERIDAHFGRGFDLAALDRALRAALAAEGVPPERIEVEFGRVTKYRPTHTWGVSRSSAGRPMQSAPSAGKGLRP